METTVIDKQVEPILKLSLQDRIYIYQILWQSILKDMQMDKILLSEEHKTEVDRRLERIDKEESKMYSWEEVKQEIKSKL